MAKSTDLPSDRQAVGQLLARLLREFRHDLAAPRAEAGFGDIRDPHMQIFGNVRMGGVRLTELADRAQLSLAATSELVNDLEEMGYLVRRPDPADGRAKLIDLTRRGRDAMSAAGDRVADIERRWSKLVGAKDFAQMCRTMQGLLDGAGPAGLTQLDGASRQAGDDRAEVVDGEVFAVEPSLDQRETADRRPAFGIVRRSSRRRTRATDRALSNSKTRRPNAGTS